MDLLSQLRQQRVLAIVRGNHPAALLSSMRILAEEGVPLIEVSLTSHTALSVVARARRELGEQVMLGAGTVLTAADGGAAVDAGATYLVTPCASAGALEATQLGVPVLVGALTPTEVATALEHHATAVKLFPAELGGPNYLRALRAPYPQVPFVPVGGVDITSARTYLAHGAVAVGIGSPLLADAPDGGNLDALRQRVRELRAAIPPLAQEPA